MCFYKRGKREPGSLSLLYGVISTVLVGVVTVYRHWAAFCWHRNGYGVNANKTHGLGLLAKSLLTHSELTLDLQREWHVSNREIDFKKGEHSERM